MLYKLELSKDELELLRARLARDLLWMEAEARSTSDREYRQRMVTDAQHLRGVEARIDSILAKDDVVV